MPELSKKEIRQLKEQGDKLFAQRRPLLSLLQDIAENFYPERADFTSKVQIGDRFTDNLTSSFPIMQRRDLGNAISGMLRPKDKQWFFAKAQGIDLETQDAKQWMFSLNKFLASSMYNSKTGFIRATKSGDHDFITFGQCVLSVEFNPKTRKLLYRNWHIRDVAWAEGVDGGIEVVHRDWNPEVRLLSKLFKNIHPNMAKCLKEDPFKKVKVRHVVVPSEDFYSDKDKKRPFLSIYIDCENDHVLMQSDINYEYYIIPRWHTVSGSQYAYSPAAVASLGDGRLMQDMTLTLLEAGQKHVDPPMLAVQEAIRGDVGLFAGGITWVDEEYDERLGEVLRPLSQNSGSFPIGIEMQRDLREQIKDAWYLNKIGLPPIGPEMTAFEVGQRVSEYVRNALPLFEPMEVEYNSKLVSTSFQILMDQGLLGGPQDLPDELSGADIEFDFESPLQRAREQETAQKFLEAKNLTLEAAQLDPNSQKMVNILAALEDVYDAIGVDPTWIKPQAEVRAEMQAEAQMMQMQQMLAMAKQGGDAAHGLGNAAQSFSNADANLGEEGEGEE